MIRPHRLYVGAIGQGVFRSVDSSETFRRAADGMFVECDVRALIVHPKRAETLYLGSEMGVFRSDNGADSWEKLPTPIDGVQVWSLWQDPIDPNRMLAGTCPPRLFRSDDGGQSWTEPTVTMTPDCPRIMFNRVTCFAGAGERIWAGVEIDGVHRSDDGGRTWRPIGTGLSSRDIHGLVVVPARNGKPRRLIATTNNDLNISEDDGATWHPQNIGRLMPWSYCRALAQPVGRPETILLGNGEGPPGSGGRIAVSLDAGDTWQPRAMPVEGNSTVWNYAVHAADPDLIYASTVSGQVFRSADGGQRWEKLKREFGEIRALAWTP
jgi:photosystem II stability/assembly factor-like uncharacterized protein